MDRFHRHVSLSTLVLLLLGGVVVPVDAQSAGAKSPTELWLDAHRNPDQKRYFGEPIDLSLKDADLVEVLRSFAELGQFNLILQPGISGKVTVELKQVPWDQALEQILKINNLAMELTGGKAHIGPRTGARPSTASRELVTVRLDPVHADPAVIAQALSRPSAGAPSAGRAPRAGGAPSAGGALRVEGATLVIRDTRQGLQDFARVLSYIDVPSAAEESPESLARRCVELWNKLVPARPLATIRDRQQIAN